MTAACDAAEDAEQWVRAWVWHLFWKHTSLFLFMTYMHDEVWLPFILSMTMVLMIVWFVYAPIDTGNSDGRTYIPKRHRKWARFRAQVLRRVFNKVGSSFVGRVLLNMWEAITKSKRKSRIRRQRTRYSLLGTLSRAGKRTVKLLAQTRIGRMIRKVCRKTRKVCRKIRKVIGKFCRAAMKVVFILVMKCRDSPGMSEMILGALMPWTAVKLSSRAERYSSLIFTLYFVTCSLQHYSKELNGKQRTVKKIVNILAASRAAASFRKWVESAMAAFSAAASLMKWMESASTMLHGSSKMDRIEHSMSSTRAATIIYLVVGCLVLMQDYLSEAHKGRVANSSSADETGNPLHQEQDGPEEEEENYYECKQELDDFFDPEDYETVEQVTVMPATLPGRQSDLGYDSDSYCMAVDNCCSSCISNCLDDFVGPLQQVVARVKGIGGTQIVATMKGVLRWRITDDEGRVHTFLIKDSYYHKDSPYRLVSPQHLAQACYDDERGTWCGTYRNAVELHWDHNKFKRSIPLNESNIALMRSAPGFDSFVVFATAFEELTDDAGFICLPTTVSDQEDDSSDEETDPDETRGETVKQVAEREQGKTRRHPDLPDNVFPDQLSEAKNLGEMTPDDEWLKFEGEEDNQAQVHIIPEDEDVQSKSPQSELLTWHYRLGHVSFEKIRQMSARGDLPAALRDCKVPKCAACMFGKARRRAWRSKSPVNKIRTPPVSAPGSVVSMDQLISAVPGFIAQMRGFITGKRYKVITVFVDQFSDLSFVYTQKSTTAEETILAKEAFERYAKTHGVIVKHYHADNGIFAEAEFLRAVEKANQSISFCGVNAHHMNGHAEKRIRDLQENARAMLLHAKRRWPTAVTANLWPYAIRMANDVHNFAPSIKDGVSPIERFSQVQVAPRVRHSHTFGCPVYVLDGKLQVGKRLPKWEDRSRIGLFLGWSPRHSRKVALVLNLKTGHVSPQFHVVFDDLFETLRPSAGNSPPKSLWQEKAGFILDSQQGDKSAPERNSRESVVRATAQESSRASVPGELQDELQEVVQGETGDESFEQGEPSVLPGAADDSLGRASSDPPAAAAPIFHTRSGRAVRPTTKWQESLEQQRLGIVALLTVPWEVFHDEGYNIQEEMENPIAFVASTNPDIMYLDEAMRQPDKVQFQQAMIKEVETHTENGHWKIISRQDVPKGEPVLPSVWAMRRKRRIATQEVYKWKARLNLHGGKQEYGLNYWETYSPVVTWTTVRLILCW